MDKSFTMNSFIIWNLMVFKILPVWVGQTVDGYVKPSQHAIKLYSRRHLTLYWAGTIVQEVLNDLTVN